MREDSSETVAEATTPAAIDKPYPRTGYAWTVVGILVVAYMVALIDRQILSLLVGPVRRDLQINDTQLSLLIGIAFSMFYSTLAVVSGRYADRLNRRNMIIAGITLWSFATIGCGLADNFVELFIGRMLVGVGEAVLGPCAYSMIADYFPKEKRARPAAIFTMGAFMGGGAAFIFGGAVVDFTTRIGRATLPVVGDVAGWQAAFVIVGLPGLVIAVLLCLIREPARREVQITAPTLADLGRFMSANAGLLATIIFGFAVVGLLNVGVLTWAPAMFIRRFGWTAGQIGLAYGLVQLFIGSTGAVAGGWWVSRRGAKPGAVLRTASCCFLIMAPFAALAGLAPTPQIALAALSVLALLNGVNAGLAPAAVYEVAPNEFRGQLVSLYLMAGTILPYCVGIVLIAAMTDYVFKSDLAVGKSMSIVLTVAAVTGGLLLRNALRRPLAA